MKAIVQKGYGTAEVLSIEDVVEPTVGENGVLVAVRAAGLNAGDCFCMRGSPWAVRFAIGFPRPKDHILGWDMAGTVESVGEKVTRFRPGDEVFGSWSHTFAEYVSLPEDKLAMKPTNLTLEQAAAVPTAAITALQGLRDVGKMQPGQKVLIHGASGGVGTFAVQVAKVLGAEVTGVCSTRNVELVRSIGADHVFDYAKEDFTRSGKRYDLVLDNVASRSYRDLRRVLAPRGRIIPNSGHGGMRYVVKALLASLLLPQHGSMFLASPNREDLEHLKGLIEADKVKPIIDKTFRLREAQEAFRYMEESHARGKIVLRIEP